MASVNRKPMEILFVRWALWVFSRVLPASFLASFPGMPESNAVPATRTLANVLFLPVAAGKSEPKDEGQAAGIVGDAAEH